MRLNNAEERDGFDYHMEHCLGNHAHGDDRYLDLYGSHGNGNCGPSSHGIHKGHSLMKYVYARFGKMVPGVLVEVEPRTHKVLLDQFSQAQCRQLFPKRPSKKRTQDVKDIVDELDLAMKLAEGKDKRDKVRDLTARMDALNTANTKEDKKAVRLDVQFKYGQDELLIDCSITHSLAKSHRRAEAKRTWERLLSNIEAVQDKGAAAIEAARSVKNQTYNPLNRIRGKKIGEKA